ncbi:MAG: TIGR00282 family metallophosphoesterase [Candidatus Omnitrophica bacterium]|nr:TIGR00282 family metallophosphoesterase [Candidatus Omnitrophota bacterium]
MKLLFIGDVVGRPAREYLKSFLPRLRCDLGVDFVVANGENVAGGSSFTEETTKVLFNAEVDVVTSGDHVFKKKESKFVVESMDVIRPLNYGDDAPGKGYIIKTVAGQKIAVINLLGRVFMPPMDCPFKAVDSLLKKIKDQVKIIFVDFHAEATSEKVAMGYFLSGRVSAVCGTHTHIPTADERIIDGATAYITDVGMTGSFDSVLGREKAAVIERFFTNMPVRFNLAHDDVRIQGVVIDVDSQTGKALSIKRVEYCQA